MSSSSSRLLNCEYHYLNSPAPTPEILADYRRDRDWIKCVQRFEELLNERGVPQPLDRALFKEKPCCLLCSEPSPERCHRRLVAEGLSRLWGDVQIVHLGDYEHNLPLA